MRASDVDPKILRGTVNISVLSKYKLSGPSGSFSHIDMPLTLARIDNNAGMKALFDGLTQIAKIAPFPAEPFQAVTEALSTLTADIFKANNNKSDAYPSAILGYELVDDVSECSENPQALRTGAQAQIFSGPEKIDGVIDIGKYNNYCYYATVGSDPNIVYAPAPGDGMCPATQPAKTTLLLNPQIIFVVNAYPINKITKPAAVAISPTATIAVSDISKNKSSEFSEFARKMQNSVGIPNQYLGVKDLSSLLGKIKAIGDHPAQTRTLVLSAQDRATLALSEAFRNCALVGLSADKCH